MAKKPKKVTDTQLLDWLEGPCPYLNIRFTNESDSGIISCDSSGKRKLRLAIQAAMKMEKK